MQNCLSLHWSIVQLIFITYYGNDWYYLDSASSSSQERFACAAPLWVKRARRQLTHAIETNNAYAMPALMNRYSTEALELSLSSG